VTGTQARSYFSNVQTLGTLGTVDDLRWIMCRIISSKDA